MKKIQYAGRVYDANEIENLIQSANEFQLTEGRFIKEFEKELSSFLDVKYSLMVNSGSSANLLAFMTLTSPLLGNKRIKRGDEIITTVCCFPTTVSPIVNYGCIPVFVDVNLQSANIKVEELEKALSPKTKAIFIAHTLGLPFDIEAVEAFCKKYNLWLISDCCDSLGTRYMSKSLESYGDISTSSFYPAHHITTGQGGAIHTNNSELFKIAKSFAYWGRDFKCLECKPNCEKRFEDGYDCRYTYSHFGMNLRPTEMQAAIGLAQIKKLPEFIERRFKNWGLLRTFLNLKGLDKYFRCQDSDDTLRKSWIDYSPFACLLTLTSNCEFTRDEIVQFLEKNEIETRPLFAGNILMHQCFSGFDIPNYRVIGDLDNSTYILDNSFFVGVYPKLDEKDLNFIVEKIKEFVEGKKIMNIIKARQIAETAWKTDRTVNLKVDLELLNAFANILAEETTDAFLKGVKFGKGYKVEDEG